MRPEILRVGDLKVGEIVIYTEGDTWHHRDVWAKIARVTPKGTLTATSRYAEREVEKEIRPSRDGVYRELRRPTEAEIAYRKWRREKPKTKFVTLRTAVGREAITGIDVADFALNEQDDDAWRATREDMVTAASELVAMANWLGTKP